MISQLCSIAIIGTFIWMAATDPAHKLHHETHHAAPPPVVRVTPLPKLPTKQGTTSAAQWHRALAEAATLLEAAP